MPNLITDVVDNGSVGAGTSVFDLGKGLYHRLTCTATTRTIGAPVSGAVASEGDLPDVAGTPKLDVGTLIFIEVKATGASLALTWNAIFKQAAANPATGTRRVYMFVWDGTNFVQVSDNAAVPN
jgi:hypothetical protein